MSFSEQKRPRLRRRRGPDDALEAHGRRLVVEGAFEGGHALDCGRVLGADGVVFGDDEAEGLGDVFRDALVGAELGGDLEGDAGAGVALWGGLGAIPGHCRRSFSSCAVGRRPNSCPSVRLKEARPGRPASGAKRRAGASAEGRRREAILYREEFGPLFHEKLFLALFSGGPKGKIVECSRCWPTGLGLSRP